MTFLFCFVCQIFDSSHIILSCIGLSLITIPSKLIFSIDEMNFTTLLIKEKGKYHTVGTIPISYRKIVVCLFFCCLMVFNATFNNISVISWRSVLLVEVTGVLGENNQPAASHWQTLYHIMLNTRPDRD